MGAAKNALEVAGETVPGNMTEIPAPLIVLKPHLPLDHKQEAIMLGELLCACWLGSSCQVCLQDNPILNPQL